MYAPEALFIIIIKKRNRFLVFKIEKAHNIYSILEA